MPKKQAITLLPTMTKTPHAPIILGPTGYWYVKSINDNKPVSLMVKSKAKWNQRGERFNNSIMAGIEWTATGNRGRGLYYDDLQYAPTWREYRFDKLPWMHNVALYAEDRFTLTTSEQGGELQVTGGLRADVTHISQSEYGTVSSWSPRLNVRYALWQHREEWWLQGLSAYCGWGKSVKLPSFEVLYPSPSYADRLAFVPGSTADNRIFYAYSVTPFKPIVQSLAQVAICTTAGIGIEAEHPWRPCHVGHSFPRPTVPI